MFAKLLQNSELPFNEQKSILKAIIQTKVKQNLPEVKLQFNHHYNALKPILLNHWKYALHICMSLVNWQTARDYLEGTSDNKVFDLMLGLAALNSNKIFQYMVIDLVKVFSDQWRQLVIVAFISQFVTSKINTNDYSWFISGFIRISALTIQNYLKLKNEPASSSQDRLQNDAILLSNVQKWVAGSYVKMITRLKRPQTSSQKTILISAFSQIAGALYEIQKQQQINEQKLLQIFTSITIYIFRNYRFDQILKLFVDRLISIGYNNPLKKIEIPEKYDQTTQFATAGICLLINQYLTNFASILSSQIKLNAYLILYSQMLCTPFKLKDQILNKIKQLMVDTSYNPNLQNQYPLSLLLFNIHQHNKAEYQYFINKTKFKESKLIRINQLKRLLKINIQKLNVEKTQFIVTNLDEDCLGQKQVLFLIKVITFDFINQELSTLIVSLYEKVLKVHNDLGKKVIRDVIERQRLAKHNLQLCEEIQKKFLK